MDGWVALRHDDEIYLLDAPPRSGNRTAFNERVGAMGLQSDYLSGS